MCQAWEPCTRYSNSKMIPFVQGALWALETGGGTSVYDDVGFPDGSEETSPPSSFLITKGLKGRVRWGPSSFILTKNAMAEVSMVFPRSQKEIPEWNRHLMLLALCNTTHLSQCDPWLCAQQPATEAQSQSETPKERAGPSLVLCRGLGFAVCYS